MGRDGRQTTTSTAGGSGSVRSRVITDDAAERARRIASLKRRYARLLRKFLENGEEEALLDVYRLGREAVVEERLSIDAEQIGNDIGGFHGAGHGANSDIGSLIHNNYVPRFYAWHGSIDSQWWWREPRFARWNAATGLRERFFHPVQYHTAQHPSLS